MGVVYAALIRASTGRWRWFVLTNWPDPHTIERLRRSATVGAESPQHLHDHDIGEHEGVLHRHGTAEGHALRERMAGARDPRAVDIGFRC